MCLLYLCSGRPVMCYLRMSLSVVAAFRVDLPILHCCIRANQRAHACFDTNQVRLITSQRCPDVYTALPLWCFVKLTQLRPSRLDPVSVVAEEHVSARLSSGPIWAAEGGMPLSLIGGCNRTLVTAESVDVSYQQATHPILQSPGRRLALVANEALPLVDGRTTVPGRGQNRNE
jgi:hypothetical protein